MNKNQVEKVIWWALKNLLGNLLPFIPFASVYKGILHKTTKNGLPTY